MNDTDAETGAETVTETVTAAGTPTDTRPEATPDVGPVVAGARLADRYTLSRLIGTGGMASVWLAHDPRLDRDVAIKIISDTLALDATFVERFAREARIAGALSHPHVVGVYDYGAHGGRPYLVMEYVPGGTLSTRLKERRTDWNAVALARELLDALAHIHAAGILHRDLKPANVLIGPDGRARLTDFGIAHLADGAELTGTGFVVGTEKYLAPEVRRGAPATVTSDLYALGVLLRECGAGTELRPLVDRLTDPEPTRRPESAAAARALLDAPSTELPPTEPIPAEPDEETATQATVVPTAIDPLRDVTPDAATPVAPSRPGKGDHARPLGLSILLALALVSVVILMLAHRNSGPGPLHVPPAGGSVTQQLDQLDKSIDHARR